MCYHSSIAAAKTKKIKNLNEFLALNLTKRRVHNMRDHNWALLTKVPDLVMRGALIIRLGEVGIEVYAPERDAIVNVSSSPNLSLEGYSALFDGYSVYVPATRMGEAKEILIKVEEQAYGPAIGETDHAKKFYFASVMSFIVPVILHFVALYHLFLALKKGQRLRAGKTIFSIFVLLASLSVVVATIQNF
jgi:hypothetical protein